MGSNPTSRAISEFSLFLNLFLIIMLKLSFEIVTYRLRSSVKITHENDVNKSGLTKRAYLCLSVPSFALILALNGYKEDNQK